MGKTISIIGQSLVGLIYIIELIIAIRVAMHKNTPNLARKFYWYPLVGTIVWLVVTLTNLHIVSSQISFGVNTISLLFHYSFLSFFIFSISEFAATSPEGDVASIMFSQQRLPTGTLREFFLRVVTQRTSFS